MKIRPARPEEHQELCKLARSHPSTSSFSNFMFSGEHAYRKGWIRVALDPTDTIVGLTCVRHKVKAPETTLYYIVVRPGIRTRGIGTELIVDLMRQCPHPRIVLSCLKKNTPALKFYEKLGFNRVGEALKGEGYQLVKEW